MRNGVSKMKSEVKRWTRENECLCHPGQQMTNIFFQKWDRSPVDGVPPMIALSHQMKIDCHISISRTPTRATTNTVGRRLDGAHIRESSIIIIRVLADLFRAENVE